MSEGNRFGDGFTATTFKPGAQGRRAIIRGRYSRTGKVTAAKASARYIETRENTHGESMQRTVFSETQNDLSRQEVYLQLEKADESYAYRYNLVLAPETDKDADHIDLVAYSREVMAELERSLSQKIAWVAATHEGESAHTEHAHVHIIAATDKLITPAEFEHVRAFAGEAFNHHRELALDLFKEHEPLLITPQHENTLFLAGEQKQIHEVEVAQNNVVLEPDTPALEATQQDAFETYEAKRIAMTQWLHEEAQGKRENQLRIDVEHKPDHRPEADQNSSGRTPNHLPQENAVVSDSSTNYETKRDALTEKLHREGEAQKLARSERSHDLSQDLE